MLLDDTQTKAHYPDEYDAGFRMNILKVSNEDFGAVCAQMHAFQEKNNSLSH